MSDKIKVSIQEDYLKLTSFNNCTLQKLADKYEMTLEKLLTNIDL